MMIHPKPATFFKITPINQTGITIVDLGEMDDVPQASAVYRHSSLPPQTRTSQTSHGEYRPREGRHRSLPPKSVTMESISSSAEGSESDSETNSGGEPEQPGASLRMGDNTSKIADQDDNRTGPPSAGAETKGPGSSLCTAKGVVIPRLSASIKKEKIKTCWFLLWSETAVPKPPVLHTDVRLELGDLFINQFHSKKHKAQVIQVWLLIKENGSNSRYTWKQVEANEKVHHPKLTNRILSFQPSNTQTNPTWILPNSNRRSRSSPIIVCNPE